MNLLVVNLRSVTAQDLAVLPATFGLTSRPLSALLMIVVVAQQKAMAPHPASNSVLGISAQDHFQKLLRIFTGGDAFPKT